MNLQRILILFAAALVVSVLPGTGALVAQTAKQPEVTPGPSEPNWWDVLETHYQLDMFGDLANPVTTTAEETLDRFVRAGEGPVIFEPVIALGTEQVTRGGWYVSSEGEPIKRELWSYLHKDTPEDLDRENVETVPLHSGSKIEFEPGDQPFGLWISNDNFDDGGIFSEPALVAKINERLAAQPYKSMIYALPGEANSYLIGWEYSTNDDFQDVVCIVRNVRLVE